MPSEGGLSGEISERQLTDAVIEMAQRLGWRAVHFRPGRTRDGWATPVQGDGRGFPDLILMSCTQQRCVLAELKAARGKLSIYQEDWIGFLATFKAIEVHIWLPSDWTSGAIEHVLRGVV